MGEEMEEETDEETEEETTESSLKPNWFIKKYMRLCTIEGVFAPPSSKKKDDAKKARLSDEVRYSMRVIINLHPLVESGIKTFRDEHGPLLAIQSNGDISFLREEKSFIIKAIEIASKAWHGNLPRYEAHILRPPRMQKTPTAYNPAFGGTLHDDDDDIFTGFYRDFYSSSSETSSEDDEDEEDEEDEEDDEDEEDNKPKKESKERKSNSPNPKPAMFFPILDDD